MNIKDLKSNEIKKKFKASSVSFKYRNKRKNGGNFGIIIRGFNGRDLEIWGMHDQDGLIIDLHFGFFLLYGKRMDVNSIDEMPEFINNAIEAKNE